MEYSRLSSLLLCLSFVSSASAANVDDVLRESTKLIEKHISDGHRSPGVYISTLRNSIDAVRQEPSVERAKTLHQIYQRAVNWLRNSSAQAELNLMGMEAIELLYQTGQARIALDSASRLIAQVMAKDTIDFDWRYRLRSDRALWRIRFGEYASAKNDLLVASDSKELKPSDSFWNALSLADLYTRMGDFARADQELARAASLARANTPEPYFNMIWVDLARTASLRTRGQAEEAMKLAQATLKLSEQDNRYRYAEIWANQNVAMALVASGKVEEALPVIQRAVELAGKQLPAWDLNRYWLEYELYCTFVRLGKKEEAKAQRAKLTTTLTTTDFRDVHGLFVEYWDARAAGNTAGADAAIAKIEKRFGKYHPDLVMIRLGSEKK